MLLMVGDSFYLYEDGFGRGPGRQHKYNTHQSEVVKLRSSLGLVQVSQRPETWTWNIKFCLLLTTHSPGNFSWTPDELKLLLYDIEDDHQDEIQHYIQGEMLDDIQNLGF